MAYKALYRAYRPTTFDEVAGQEHIVKTLKNALSQNKIAHAYLFAGPRGTGKTTMAKLFAKALNCDGGTGKQCNTCKNCVAINESNHPDVIELDAASNNGVNEIRELIEKVKYGTILGKTKVYIIDEVHMLSTGAFNALLKTLEEPPAHVVFILATTEPHKILPTILSRCQRYDFARLKDDEIKNRIKVVLEKENIASNDSAINLIVELADGGMRDALSILDQVLAYSGDTLNTEDILDMFSLESKEEKIALVSSIVSKDVVDVMKRLNNYIKKGTDIKRLTNDLLNLLKDGLIYQKSRRSDFLETLTDEEAKKVSSLMDEKQLLDMIDILMEANKDYKNVSSVNPLFEITLLKMISLDKNIIHEIPETSSKKIIAKTPVNETSKKENKPIESLIEHPIKEKKIEIVPLIEEERSIDIIKKIDKVLYLKNIEHDGVFKIDDDLMINIIVSSKKEIKSELKDQWKNIKKFTMHPELGKAASLLADCHPLVASKQIIILETQFEKISENINKKDIQESLQNVALNSFGKQMFIYAIPMKESIRIQQQYMNLASISKLPKIKEINLDFIEEEKI